MILICTRVDLFYAFYFLLLNQLDVGVSPIAMCLIIRKLYEGSSMLVLYNEATGLDTSIYGSASLWRHVAREKALYCGSDASPRITK